jgi:hypothetical protein
VFVRYADEHFGRNDSKSGGRNNRRFPRCAFVRYADEHFGRNDGKGGEKSKSRFLVARVVGSLGMTKQPQIPPLRVHPLRG